MSTGSVDMTSAWQEVCCPTWSTLPAEGRGGALRGPRWWWISLCSSFYIYLWYQDLATLPLQTSLVPVTLVLTNTANFSPLVVENTTLKLEDQFDNGAIFETFSRILDEVFFGPEFLQLPFLEIGNQCNKAITQVILRLFLFRFRVHWPDSAEQSDHQHPGQDCGDHHQHAEALHQGDSQVGGHLVNHLTISSPSSGCSCQTLQRTLSSLFQRMSPWRFMESSWLLR